MNKKGKFAVEMMTGNKDEVLVDIARIGLKGSHVQDTECVTFCDFLSWEKKIHAELKKRAHNKRLLKNYLVCLSLVEIA